MYYIIPMKRTFSLALIIFLMTCSSSKNVKKEIQITEITGKIEVTKESKVTYVYIVENWKTRSRVSYEVVNQNEFIKYKGKILKVTAELLEKGSPFSGKVRITKVIEEIKN